MYRLDIDIPHENRLAILPVSPGVFFALWDFSASRNGSFIGGELGGEVEVRLFSEQPDIPAVSSRFKWDSYGGYLNCEPKAGTFYAYVYAERGGEWEKLAESNRTQAPAPSVSVDERAYASLEFHKKKVGA